MPGSAPEYVIALGCLEQCKQGVDLTRSVVYDIDAGMKKGSWVKKMSAAKASREKDRIGKCRNILLL